MRGLPVWYGRVKDYPDFAATPWGEFVANDQYLNVLLSPTMGSMEYEAVYVDDTVFWESTNADDKICGAKAIAFEMSCSIRTVYRRAEEPGVSIYKPCGRYSAFKSELRDWLKRTPDCHVLSGSGRYPAQRYAIVFAEVRDRLVIRCESTQQPHDLDIAS